MLETEHFVKPLYIPLSIDLLSIPVQFSLLASNIGFVCLRHIKIEIAQDSCPSDS